MTPVIGETKASSFFWHFPSHWPASRAILLPFRLECCFWALIWYFACWYKLYFSKIPTKRISVEPNPEIFVASQYRFFSAPRVPGYWLFTKIPGSDSTGLLFVETHTKVAVTSVSGERSTATKLSLETFSIRMNSSIILQ